MLIMYFYKTWFLIQEESITSFLKIYDGGSEKADMISLSNVISTPRSQIFIVFNSNGTYASIKLNATVIESK